MTGYSTALRTRIGTTLAAVAFGVVALAGCGTLVSVSSHITPIPPNCTSPRSAAAIDSFSTPVALQQGGSGLEFGDISVGCGRVAGANATARVLFTVWLQDGTQVATTRGTGQPTSALALGNPQTLAFWRVGVPGMRVGGTRKLVVPPALAFGAGGNSSAGVPPNATLIVDVELVSLG